MPDKQVVPNCVNCGAPMRLDRAEGSFVCSHCGSINQPPEIVRHVDIGTASEKTCPSCATALSQGRLDGFPLLVCQRCNGMLIEMEHFVSVIEAARAHEQPAGTIPPRRQSPGDRTIRCPTCQRAMLSHFYGGPGNLVIDTCERCRLNWLDPGEMCRIARAS
jgi:Zn-finger nucleic acid-binding protein